MPVLKMRNELGSRRALVAIVVALAVLLASLRLAAGRENRRPGPLPPAEVAAALQHVFSIGGGTDGPLASPLAVAVGRRGQVFVADGGTRAVEVFDASGMWLRTIGKGVAFDPKPGEIVYPLGVTLDDDENVYVADGTGGHISVFDNRGSFLRYFAEDEQGRKPFGLAAGILYRDGLLYVNDLAEHRVVVLRSDGGVERRLGTGRGTGEGELLYPNYLWVDGDGHVAVADSNNNRVVVFAPDGAVEQMLVSGHGDSGTSVLRGIARDAQGNLHVVSPMDHRVMVFDRAGNLAYAYGGEGEGTTQLGFPNGLTISNERIYVADRANGRVQVWRLKARPGSGN